MCSSSSKNSRFPIIHQHFPHCICLSKIRSNKQPTLLSVTISVAVAQEDYGYNRSYVDAEESVVASSRYEDPARERAKAL